MNENDLIAEYIKKRYPEILQTMDFAVFKLGKAISKVITDCFDPIKNLVQQIINTVPGQLVNAEAKQDAKEEA